jgi:hypothetical protein
MIVSSWWQECNPRGIHDKRFLKGRVTHQAIYLIRPLLCHLSMTSSQSYSYSLAHSSAVALWEILVLRGSRAVCNVELQTRALVQSDDDAKRWTRWNTPKCTCFLLGGAERCRREAMNASEHSWSTWWDNVMASLWPMDAEVYQHSIGSMNRHAEMEWWPSAHLIGIGTRLVGSH